MSPINNENILIKNNFSFTTKRISTNEIDIMSILNEAICTLQGLFCQYVFITNKKTDKLRQKLSENNNNSPRDDLIEPFLKLTRYLNFKQLMVIFLLTNLLIMIGCKFQNKKKLFYGCWEDSKGSELTFYKNSHIEMRLFDLLNADELKDNEIIDSPSPDKLYYRVYGQSDFNIKEFKIEGKSALLKEPCSSSFVLEFTELLESEHSNERNPRVRWWGQRKIDAYYESIENNEAIIYFLVEVGGEVLKITIARAQLLNHGLLNLIVDDYGVVFFTIGRKFGRCKESLKKD